MILEGLTQPDLPRHISARASKKYRGKLLSPVTFMPPKCSAARRGARPPGTSLRRLDLFIEEHLKESGKARVTRISDCVFAGAFGALKLAMSMRMEYWDQMRKRDSGRKAA